MIEALLVVLTNAVEGRDADFNDWYSNIHARDTMRMRGALAQQRFRFSEEQVQTFETAFPAKYLALYEVYDAAWFSQEHIDRARTPYMVVEDSLDMSRLDDYFYYPLFFRDKKPRNFPNCSVVLEQMQAPEGREAEFREWYSETYVSKRFRESGVDSVAFLAFEDYGQMMPFPPAHNHVAIWRLSDDAARKSWRDSNPLEDCPFIETAKTAVSCWDIASKRIFKDQVTYPDSESLAKEEAARARIKAQGSELRDAKQRIKD